jgi:hypothetical protein
VCRDSVRWLAVLALELVGIRVYHDLLSLLKPVCSSLLYFVMLNSPKSKPKTSAFVCNRCSPVRVQCSPRLSQLAVPRKSLARDRKAAGGSGTGANSSSLWVAQAGSLQFYTARSLVAVHFERIRFVLVALSIAACVWFGRFATLVSHFC